MNYEPLHGRLKTFTSINSTYLESLLEKNIHVQLRLNECKVKQMCKKPAFSTELIRTEKIKLDPDLEMKEPLIKNN